jgi:hypothetical protein
MANSTALAYRQSATVDNSGTGAGTQWLHRLWHLYQYFFTDAEAVDNGRWRLVDSSPAQVDWGTLANIVDNSWFVVEAYAGRRRWQAKFQATNVLPLDEVPSTTYSLVVNLSSGAGWTGKGNPNGGFSTSPVFDSDNKLLGGLNVAAGADAEMFVHGDRDTVLVAGGQNGITAFQNGCYLGRFEADSDLILYPEVVLVPWNGAGGPKGFDRDPAGGCFSLNPADSFVLNAATPYPLPELVQVHTPAWMDNAHQPSAFSNEFTYRPLGISSVNAYLGLLRLVWSCAKLVTKSRMDNRQKLVLHGGTSDYGVCIKHNGVVIS